RIQPLMGVLDLAVYQADPHHKRGNMVAGCLSRARSNGEGRLAEDSEHLGRIEAADAMALEQFFYRSRTQACGSSRRRRKLPQVEQPLGLEMSAELEHRRKVSPELLAHAIGEAGTLGNQIVGNARPFAQFDDDRFSNREQPEA